jgi:preprotein translocase subunit SecA
VKANKTAETAAVAEQGANVAPEKAPSKKRASQERGAPKPARAKEASALRAESRGAMIMALIGRAKDATLAEIMTATGWQKHRVRGFISIAGKAARNKPCPCGSGKKYKNCCWSDSRSRR